MKSILFVPLLLMICFNANAQGKTVPDSLFYKVFMLDSVWVSGISKKTPLRDSLSYFEIKGNKVEYCLKTATTEKADKGKVIYWKDTEDANGLKHYSFYISGRGAFKGSLTVNIRQLNEIDYEIHILSAFATFDKRISGKIGDASEIVRPLKKKYKPGRK